MFNIKKRFINYCRYDDYEKAKNILLRYKKLKYEPNALYWSLKNNHTRITNLILKSI